MKDKIGSVTIWKRSEMYPVFNTDEESNEIDEESVLKYEILELFTLPSSIHSNSPGAAITGTSNEEIRAQAIQDNLGIRKAQ